MNKTSKLEVAAKMSSDRAEMKAHFDTMARPPAKPVLAKTETRMAWTTGAPETFNGVRVTRDIRK